MGCHLDDPRSRRRGAVLHPFRPSNKPAGSQAAGQGRGGFQQRNSVVQPTSAGRQPSSPRTIFNDDSEQRRFIWRKIMLKKNAASRREVHPVTLRTVAEYVGLAPCSVSAVLNNSAAGMSIPQPTKHRVWLAARQLNYRPNYLARALRTRRTYTVAMLMPDIGYAPAARIAAGAEDFLREHDYCPDDRHLRSLRRLARKSVRATAAAWSGRRNRIAGGVAVAGWFSRSCNRCNSNRRPATDHADCARSTDHPGAKSSIPCGAQNRTSEPATGRCSGAAVAQADDCGCKGWYGGSIGKLTERRFRA